MRETKYQGVYKRKVWPVTKMHFFNGGEVSEVALDTDAGESDMISIEDVKLREYTGLKDKNGKEIYEGDILKVWDGAVHQVVFGKQNIGHDWQGVGWFTCPPGKEYDCFHEYYDCEVVGNIYEHPELLK